MADQSISSFFNKAPQAKTPKAKVRSPQNNKVIELLSSSDEEAAPTAAAASTAVKRPRAPSVPTASKKAKLEHNVDHAFATWRYKPRKADAAPIASTSQAAPVLIDDDDESLPSLSPAADVKNQKRREAFKRKMLGDASSMKAQQGYLQQDSIYAPASDAVPASSTNAKSKGKGKEPAVKYTPLELQILELKEKHPGTILLIEVGYKLSVYCWIISVRGST